MKTHPFFRSTSSLALLALTLSTFAFAAGDHHAHGKDAGAAQVSADAKAAYPLATCVVSNENLEGGDMGGPVDYLHKEDGKPDRLVRFCCKACIRDFQKNPSKYLKRIDDAAAAKARTGDSGH